MDFAHFKPPLSVIKDYYRTNCTISEECCQYIPRHIPSDPLTCDKMPVMTEHDFWDYVRKGMADRWNSQRIEDKYTSSIPDVFYSIPVGKHSVAGMVELKVQEPNKSGGVNARHYTQEQRDFARIHKGRTFCLVRIGPQTMLFSWKVADEILRGQQVEWHESVALYHSTSPNWDTIARLLKADY